MRRIIEVGRNGVFFFNFDILKTIKLACPSDDRVMARHEAGRSTRLDGARLVTLSERNDRGGYPKIPKKH
jgi:hypothetical protein